MVSVKPRLPQPFCWLLMKWNMASPPSDVTVNNYGIVKDMLLRARHLYKMIIIKLSSISLYYYYFLLMYLHCVFCWYLARVVFLIIIWFYILFYYDSVCVQTGQKCKKFKLIKKVYEAVCELNSKMTHCKICDFTWKKSRKLLTSKLPTKVDF